MSLKKLKTPWTAASLRRTIQGVCIALFGWLFFYVCWPYGSAQYAKARDAKEFIDAEIFLALDPLLSISTAIAAKTWIWSLTCAAAILLVSVIFPRAFCSYLCPLGTLIDVFDWGISKRIKRFRVKSNGWWVNLKYYILLGTLLAAVFGVLLSGFVAAIPVVTRAMMFIFGPVQMGLLKGWYLVPPMNVGHFVSLLLFLIVLFLGLLRPRFWCSYLCPTGAVFSIANVLRIFERKVAADCISCKKCVTMCSFDAIKPDFTTRTSNCAFCRTCGGVCPVHSIKFTNRWKNINPKPADQPTNYEVPLSRRGFIAAILATLGITGATRTVFGAKLKTSAPVLPVRPPGSVPEQKFLQMCIRCGLCFKACPNNVIQPISFEQGLEGLWTPQVVANWSGCEPSCNNCGQVCPTAAIRALPLEEKRVARMGLAVINEKTCLPWAGTEECQMCVDECTAAGYNAIEFIRIGTEVDEDGMPIEGTGYLAPVVLDDKCIGCGLCQTRCHIINAKEKHLLKETAIEVIAGPGKEDRIMTGSYLALRQEQLRKKKQEQQQNSTTDYLPDFLE